MPLRLQPQVWGLTQRSREHVSDSGEMEGDLADISIELGFCSGSEFAMTSSPPRTAMRCCDKLRHHAADKTYNHQPLRISAMNSRTVGEPPFIHTVSGRTTNWSV
jgi:hypothetical protein